MGDNDRVNSWSAPVAKRPVDATVTVPGSKSITNRALVLAALATGPSTVSGVLRSRDTDLMLSALEALGVGVDIDDARPDVARISPGRLVGADVDCGLAGTVMRFLPPVAALATGTSRFDGDEAARVRPQSTILGALRDLGVGVEGDRLPFSVEGRGKVAGGRVAIDASASSQFVSGLLLSAARFDRGIELEHVGAGPVPSGPHIEMTLDMLRESGVTIRAGERSWTVEPGPIAAVDRVIEPDLSNATPFLAAAAATGGTVRIPRWPSATTQPGDAIRGLLEKMGAAVSLSGGVLTVTGPDRLSPLDEDLADVGELTPTVAALCALADGTSTLRGIAHLRGHETDRIAALATELTKVGCAVTELDDGLEVSPGELRGAQWGAYADHRMATAGAIVGLRVAGVEVDDIDSTAKTLPGFDRMWSDMLAGS